jgi:hypothetical protein
VDFLSNINVFTHSAAVSKKAICGCLNSVIKGASYMDWLAELKLGFKRIVVRRRT